METPQYSWKRKKRGVFYWEVLAACNYESLYIYAIHIPWFWNQLFFQLRLQQKVSNEAHGVGLKNTNIRLSLMLTLYSLFSKYFGSHSHRVSIFFNCHCTTIIMIQNKYFSSLIQHEILLSLAYVKITPKLRRMFPIHATPFFL